MLVVKIGGPAYRIGMGGGAASSVPSGSNKAELDFNAVQRGDAEMAQKLWRVVRSCVELGAPPGLALGLGLGRRLSLRRAACCSP
jgi:phosphoribosylformylglycinamidine synthase